MPGGMVMVNTTMSLDGFVAGPNHEMDWVFEFASDAPRALVGEVIDATGAVLGGRRGYEVGRRAERPETRRPFGGRWRGPIFILTHHPPSDEPDPDFAFLSGDIRSAVGIALDAAAGKDLLVLGADVAGQCLDERLVDEVLVLLLPVVLGDGIRLFRGGRPGRTDLETVEVSRSGQVTILRFRVPK